MAIAHFSFPEGLSPAAALPPLKRSAPAFFFSDTKRLIDTKYWATTRRRTPKTFKGEVGLPQLPRGLAHVIVDSGTVYGMSL